MDFLQYLINQGLTKQDLIMLLSAPVIILLITFSRQVVGLRGFGLFTPLLITYGLLKVGLASGTFILFAAILITTLVRYLLKHLRILYFPRLAFILAATIVFMFLAFFIALLFNFPFNFNAPALGILAIVILSERLAAVQIEQDLKTSMILTGETLFISLIGFFLLSWQFFQDLIWDNYLAIITISLLLILLVGRWSGLRILEYVRFSEIINSSR